MAHLMVPQSPISALPIFFNVDAPVGAAPAQNRREDVLLVQFLIKIVANKSAENAAFLGAIRPNGLADPFTIEAIRKFQDYAKSQNPGQIVDGRVSPAQSGYSYGPAMWIITQLNFAAKSLHTDVWPRLDKIAGCPEEIRSMVVRTLIGTAG